jgi:hypothetical protein
LTVKVLETRLTKNELGYTLGDLLTNSSGHPGQSTDNWSKYLPAVNFHVGRMVILRFYNALRFPNGSDAVEFLRTNIVKSPLRRLFALDLKRAEINKNLLTASLTRVARFFLTKCTKTG